MSHWENLTVENAKSAESENEAAFDLVPRVLCVGCLFNTVPNSSHLENATAEGTDVRREGL